VPFSTEKAIEEVIGNDGEKFESFLMDSTHSYSDRARKDHQLFIDAFRNGNIAGTV
jgi:DNA-binding ferritin-like protein (Dps family)